MGKKGVEKRITILEKNSKDLNEISDITELRTKVSSLKKRGDSIKKQIDELYEDMDKPIEVEENDPYNIVKQLQSVLNNYDRKKSIENKVEIYSTLRGYISKIKKQSGGKLMLIEI